MKSGERVSLDERDLENVTGGKSSERSKPKSWDIRCADCGAGGATYSDGKKHYCMRCADKRHITIC